jgi:hypothetical protein
MKHDLLSVARRAPRAARSWLHALAVLPTLLSVLKDLRRDASPETVGARPGWAPLVKLDAACIGPAVLRACRLMRPLVARTDAGICTVRSLAVFRALRASGVAAHWVIGFTGEGATVTGHAWVEVDGVPVAGIGDERAPVVFRELLRLPGAARRVASSVNQSLHTCHTGIEP